jgi:NAD(P)-dependent dehydrogenase (short-subunit alcohol dehydrogenase family)
MDFEDLQFEHRAWLGGWPAYAQAKVSNILFTRELARRLAGTSVTANVMHPGMTASGFGRNNRGLWKTVVAGTQLFARTPRKAAETALYLATSPEVAEESGRYFYDCHPSRAAARAVDAAAADRLWRVSEGLVHKVLGA